jgi:hypothetical protein
MIDKRKINKDKVINPLYRHKKVCGICGKKLLVAEYPEFGIR